ncbi:hypothetical protein WJX77_003916 [Trebouxia sp. C0004]
MSNYEHKARDMVAKADKKLKGYSFLGGMGAKYDDAAELLESAGNNFKLAKAWRDAGETYSKLAEIHVKQDNKADAAQAYVEASKAYQRVDKSNALRCLHKAVGYYTDLGRLGMAARNLRDVAETQEKAGLKEECIEFYDKAAELFEVENSTAEANKCRLKIAQYSAELERFPVAIEIYENIAKSQVDSNLLKYSAKGNLLNAGLCRLNVDDEFTLRSAIERYEDIDISFGGSREHNLLIGLAEAKETGDSQKFTDAVAEYDSLTRLDAWKTQLLLRVKKRLSAVADGEEEDLT